MSSKTNKVAGASSSSEQQKREHDAPSTCKTSLTPKLRFPEFRDAAGWEESRLADICSKITQGGTPDTSEPKFWGGSINWMTPAEMGKTESPFIDATTRTITESGLDNCSSYLLPIYSVILSVRAPIGSLAINTTPMAINQGCKGLITGNTLSFSFLYYSLINSKARLIDLGAGNTFKELSGSALKSYEIGLPSPPEQQRIAECLSAVDEVIAAQARKLDALKSHKKGLMQELFPREGETQPHLRFPQFQDAPEWSGDSLGQIFKTSSGGTPSRSKEEYWNGNIPWITTSLVDFNVITKADEFISDEGLKNSSAKVFPEKTILVAMYGQGKTRGQVAILGIKAATNQACAAILPRKNMDPNFVFMNLASRYEEMRGLSNSGGQKNLSQGLIQELQFSYPNDIDEQQVIAECLTFLDDLIVAQAQKLEALKTHKKGLMQQLFPSPEFNL